MKFLFRLTLFLIPFCVYGNEFFCVQGFVYDAHDVPMVGAVVMVTGTNLGAMTDAEGHYFIANVPVESSELLARTPGKFDQYITVAGQSGDTLEVNFALGPQYMPDITWRYNDETYSDTISITVSTSIDLDEAFPQIWVGNHLMPCWRQDSVTFGTAISSRGDSLQFSIFPNSPLSFALTDTADVYHIQYLPDSFAQDSPATPPATHNIVDLSKWGNPILENWGFLGFKTFYKNGSEKILLVFVEQAVLLDDTGSSDIINYPFPAFCYRTDSELNYLLIWDICGQGAIGGDAALISLEDGTWSVFDPSPEKETPDISYPRIAGYTYIDPVRISDHEMYHLTSEGTVIRLNSTDIRFFNSQGDLRNVQSLDELGLSDMHFSAQFLSENQQAVSVIHAGDSLHFRTTLSFYGSILHHSCFPYATEYRCLDIMYVCDPAQAVIWACHFNNPSLGLAQIDCMSDGYRHFQGFSRHFCTSENRSYLGISCYYPDQHQIAHEVRDWNTGEILSTLWIENTEGEYSRFIGMSNAGLCLLARPSTKSFSGFEYVLTDINGSILRSFPLLRSTQLDNSEAYLSPEGNLLIIPWGRYLDIVQLQNLSY